ncbi:MAG: molecular chaperone TorD family protein [Nitrospirae bacterium]|nr:molecular chaperone TorD family protein [Nitrospirota bacterium]
MLLDSFNQDLSQAYKVLATFYLYGVSEEVVRELSEEFEIDLSTETIEDIAEDFFNLISSPGATLPPYESLYLSSETNRRTQGERISDEVSHLYASAGLNIDPDTTGIPPDHIGLELLFIAYLIDNNMIDDLQRFFRLHMINWIPQYCDLLEKEARTEFMKEVASITRELILTDFEDLNYG